MDTDFLGAIRDEVALEGLDGISIESLWVRLSARQNFSIKLTDKSKAYLWRCLVTLQGLEYYEIPEPQPPLVVYNSLESFDPDSGRLIELEQVPEDPYPIDIVSKDGIYGSCSMFETRKNVTALVKADGKRPAVTLEEARNTWGEKLVIVASQEIRENAICGHLYDPSHNWSAMTHAYCILERIGRSRYNGCMSVGPFSLQVFSMPPKTIFYHTKILVRLGLVKKQSLTVVDMKHKQQIRRIFHLERFYKEIQSKYSILILQACNYLASRPNHREVASTIREHLEVDATLFKKLYYSYPNFLRADKLPYRDLFPEATEEEYLCKNRLSEKMVHSITMVQHVSVKKEDSEDEGEDEEEDEDGADDTGNDLSGKAKLGKYEWVYERTTLQQCYDAIKNVGPEGVTQTSLTKILNVGDNMARVLIKNMIRMNMVDQILKEKGKQKVKYFIAKEHRLQSKLYQEFVEEKEKLFQKEELSSGNADPHLGSGPSMSNETPPANDTETEVTMDISVSGDINDGVNGIKKENTKGETTVIRSCEDLLAVDEVKEGVKKTVKFKTRRNMAKDKRSDLERTLTSRHLKRMSMILEAVEKDKVLEKTHTFIKMIREREKTEGLDCIIDKKTFDKLAILLVKEKKIRIFKTNIPGSNNEQLREVQLLCAKHIQPTDALIKSKLEQLHLRSRCVPKERLVKAPKKSPAKQQKFTDLPESTQENLRKLQEYKMKIKSFDMVYDPIAPKQYGYLPKMRRLCMAHNILWYLCYDYRGCVLPESSAHNPSESTPGRDTSVSMETQSEAIGTWSDDLKTSRSTEISRSDVAMETDQAKSQGHMGSNKPDMETEDSEKSIDVDIFEQIRNLKEPPVFCDEMSWRRYLPPLPKHKDHPKGWCLISDVLVTLPVSLFCAMVPVSYNLQGLKEILDDPVKSLYPIVYLPYRLTQQLLFARKYIFAFHENCERLAYMGLLSFGTRLLKEKDQVFVYLYKNVCLRDTTRSLEGYCKITMPDGIKCDKRTYTLHSQLEFDHYWTELQEICFASHLNVRKMKNTARELKEDPPVDLSLPECLKPVSPDKLVDDPAHCRLPGDQQGAAGMDSSFYTHLYRNWDWSMKTMKRNFPNYTHMGPLELKPDGLWTSLTKSSPKSTDKYLKVTKPNRLPRILPKERLMLTDTGTGKGPEVVKVTTSKTKGNKGGKGVKRKRKMSGGVSKKKTKVELLRTPKSPRKKRVFRDEIDIEAEKVRTGQRVSWSAKEDSILLTCKIACSILALNSQGDNRSIPVPYFELRNVLHKYCKEKSKDKTTEACKRRISFILKNPRTEHNLSVFLSEALQDQKIDKEYARKKVMWMSEDTIKDFRNLFELLIKKFSTVDLKQSHLPSHLSELPEFNVKMVKKINLHAITHRDVQSTADMYIAVLRNIIQTYAALEDKQGRVYECLKLLNQYPRDCIITATTQLRSNRVITRIKAHERKKQRIPSSLQNYKISQKYWYGYISRFPSSLFEDSVESLHLFENTFKDPSQPLTFNNITQGGYCACIISLMSLGIISFHSQIPNDMIILDPCNEQSWRGLSDPRIDPNKGTASKQSGAQESTACIGESAGVTQGPVPMETDATDEAVKVPEVSAASNSDTSNITSTSKPGHKSSSDADNQMATVGLHEPYWVTDELVKVVVSPTSCFEMEDLPQQLSFPGLAGKTQPTPSRSLITIRRSCAEDAQNLKHFKFQDNFVISSCNIRMKIKAEDEESKGDNQGQRTVAEIVKDVLFSPEEMKRILHKITRTLPFELDMELVWESITPPLLAPCQQLYNAIDSHGGLGISKFDLQDLFVTEDWYCQCLDLLDEKFAVSTAACPFLFVEVLACLICSTVILY
ncbi:general transcription factor 3C polypeptide 1-like [Mizuhopecten yessoensis]|uniref:General transcription factor 3C polypeptide 1 n=1 Tax=Mizuhopecten yessoensis TaxID=6573 RepID=A0A210Q496_MIZYE|nr:general transcription factor 3C polypeptide 1-like [Mizuhopecten yessoensis]OWF43564.1 General transcription factor 3C polypeptide 1 [Mizuhopecten yessoensis]